MATKTNLPGVNKTYKQLEGDATIKKTPTASDMWSKWGGGDKNYEVAYAKITPEIATAINNLPSNSSALNTTTEYTGARLDIPEAYQGSTAGNTSGGGNSGGGGSNGGSYYNPTADLLAALQTRQEAQRQNYEATLEQLRKAYDTTVGDIKNQSEEALRQAYIKMMLDKRGLNQSLEAAGLRGGATESAMAGLYNNYADNRNAIAQAVARNLASAGNEYGENIANLGMQYNTNTADALANYQTQLANASQSLAKQMAKTSSNVNGTQNTLNSYADILQALYGDGNNVRTSISPAKTTATNTAASTPNYQGDLSSEMQQYRIRNYTPAKIRNMAPADAFEYVMALNTDNETKQAILEDAGFDLNALVAMMG